MKKRFFQVCSFFLCIALLISMLPMSVFAEEVREAAANAQAAIASTETMKIPEHSDAHIVDEIVENRTEFSKEFLLSNGLHVAAVYADAVHYETEDGWEEIDNTLKANTEGTLTNTAGVWDVSFPQQLSKDKTVTIEKDGYTLSFAMTGELRNTGLEVMGGVKEESVLTAPTEDVLLETTELPEAVTEPTVISVETTPAETTEPVPEETAPVETMQETVTPATDATEPAATTPTTDVTVPETTEETVSSAIIEETTETLLPTQTLDAALETASVTIDGAVQTFAVSSAKVSTANVQKIDLTEAKAAARYEGLVAEKNASQLLYANVFGNTNVQYDLQGNRVKESVILNAYDSSLRGYRYTLHTGDMIPVLYSDGGIELRDAKQENIIMYMPAPYLLDNAKEYNSDIQVSLTGGNGVYTLTYLLPAAWLASSDRQWPVVLDPVVTAKPSVINIRDHTVASNGSYSYLRPVLECGFGPTNHQHRFFIKHRDLPALKSSDVIISAWISLYKPESGTTEVPVNVHKVLDTWESETLTWANKPDYDPTVEDYTLVTGKGWYSWNITDIARDWYSGENTGIMFKAADAFEDGSNTDTWKQFASADNGVSRWLPSLTIAFRNNNGLEDYWDYEQVSAGYAGTGYINNYTGNLVWIREDLGFGGTRMPVSITHVHNANDASNSSFGLGYGWRTNYNQRIISTYINNEKYYIWEDSDGTSHYFENEYYGVFKDEDGLELTLKYVDAASNTDVAGDQYSITDKKGNVSVFDSNGRLIRLLNDQEIKSSITITYTTASGLLIDTITDGAGRTYQFTYTNNLLSRISYKGKGNTEITYLTFGYTDNHLTSVTDKEGNVCDYRYNNKLLKTIRDIDDYSVNLSYNTVVGSWQPYRVKSVSEVHNGENGGSLTYEYAHNQTVVTDHNGNVQIIQFNNMGNTVSIQDDEGCASFAKYAKNEPEETGKGNQLSAASKLQNTVSSLLNDGSFESDSTWTVLSGSGSRTVTEEQAYYGGKSLAVTNALTLRSIQFEAAANIAYTFSAYVKTDGTVAELQLTAGSEVFKSVSFPANNGWSRMEVTFPAQAASTTVSAQLVTTGTGTTYVDCAQLEKAQTASRYNLVENSDFRSSAGWSSLSGRVTGTPAAPVLDSNVYQMTGDPREENRISQTVQVSGSEGDTLVLIGWAKGNSAYIYEDDKLPSGQNKRVYALYGTFRHTDGTTSDPFIAHFNPDADQWQYSAQVMVAKQAYSSVKIELVYDYNVNTVCFDGIQLYKEEFGSSYDYDDEGNMVSVVDLQKKNTEYEYDTDNNLTKIIQNNKAKMTYTYDDHHNVLTATTEEGQVYSFTYDDYGNNTSVSIGRGYSKITSSAAYSTDDHNRIVSTTDALGKVTYYDYDASTNVLHWVQCPENTDGTDGTTDTRTKYTYDDMYRTATVACAAIIPGTTDTPLNLSTEYDYENGLLSEIQTGSTIYSFDYGNFALLKEVKAGSRTLATYNYKDRDHYLERLDYGNGDRVEYDYDSKGRKTKVVYEDDAYVTYSYDNDGALDSVTDSNDSTTTYYYDLTGRVVKYVESGELSFHSVGYEYDDINNLAATVENINGTEISTTYTYDDDNRIVSKQAGDVQLTYNYDGFGRVASQTTAYSGTVMLTENFTYNGNSTQIHTYATTVGNTTTTYTYTYDDNGNIISVSDGTNTTTYAYDSANQLLRENNQTAGKTWTWEYDNAGNILESKEYAYTTVAVLAGVTPFDTVTYQYSDLQGWGDLLTAYNGSAIQYDEIGNPINDGAWSYTWEHGRQLASMSRGTANWSYTYGADGLRTYRTDGDCEYEYVYSGGLLQYMYTNGTELRFFYDSNGTPVSVIYGNKTYLYVTNLQGDVVALLDTSGKKVVEYTYDAWGNIVSMRGSRVFTLGHENPLRYRGYVYDRETELYYLQSRYYDPEMGRFINADGNLTGASTGVVPYNLFACCIGQSHTPPIINTAESKHTTKDSIVVDFRPIAPSLSIIYSVPLYNQGSLKLCWAFCQVMIEDYYAGRIRSNDQATARAIEIAKTVHGDDWNHGGWPTNAPNVFGELGEVPPTIEELYSALVQNGPFYAYYGGDDGAHLVVITGVDLCTGLIYTNNPWGILGRQSYDDFLLGFAGKPSTMDMPFGFVIYPEE